MEQLTQCSGNVTAHIGHVPFMIQPTQFIVVMAFFRSDDRELVPAFDVAEFDSEEQALRTARDPAGKHVGVIAWSRQAEPGMDGYRPTTVLFQSGDVPDME
jgi:hypothetical protein